MQWLWCSGGVLRMCVMQWCRMVTGSIRGAESQVIRTGATSSPEYVERHRLSFDVFFTGACAHCGCLHGASLTQWALSLTQWALSLTH